MEEVGVVASRDEADFLRFCGGAFCGAFDHHIGRDMGLFGILLLIWGVDLADVCFLHGVYIIVQHPLNIVRLVFERRRLRVPKVAQQAQLLVVSFLQDLTTNYPL